MQYQGLDDFYTCSDSVIWLSYYTPSYIPSLLQCMYFWSVTRLGLNNNSRTTLPVHKNTINNIFYLYTHFPIISVLLLWWCNIFLLHKVLRCTLYGWYRRFLWWKQGFQQVHRTLQLLADKHIHHSNIEILEYWNIGILKCQNANMLICWKVKMLKC